METFERENFKSISIAKHTPESMIAHLGKECHRCNHCCKMDSGILFDDDITRIADYLHMPRDEFKKEFLEEHERFHTKCWKLKQIKADMPYGRCVLLKEDGCSVHEAKPKYCALLSTASKHGQQLAVWFALNHFVNPNDPESIRQWAVYLKTHPTIPGGNLQDLVPDKEKLRAILAYETLH
jgi:Fe-S-cluster containining protein